MAELFGKATAVAGGYGGSMHLLDVERSFYGGWGIVGGHLPIAVGAALALDQTETPGVVLCQLGDGATNIGAFHEALNLAAVWNLPIVFHDHQQPVRNGHVASSQASAEPELFRRAAAYRMHGERVDGNDLLAVAQAAGAPAARGARGAPPAVLELHDLPLSAATRSPTPGMAYRTREEIDEWRQRDPIERVAREPLDRARRLRAEDEVDAAAAKEVADEIVGRRVRERRRSAARRAGIYARASPTIRADATRKHRRRAELFRRGHGA